MTKRITRKGSKQLTDEERASQVASRTIPPVIAHENKGDDDEGEENGGRPPHFLEHLTFETTYDRPTR